MANIPPPQSGMKPMDYYLFLYRSGVSPYEAYQATSAAYGPPKSKEQLAQEQQSNAAKGNLAAVAGQTAGLVGGTYLAGQAAGLFSAGGSSAGAIQTALAAKAAEAAAAGGVAAGGTAAGGVAGGTAAGGTAAGGTAAAAGGTTTLGSIGSIALPVAAVVGTLSTAWETGMKDILRGRGDRADWINQGANLATAFVPNLALKLLGKRSIGSMMTSGKSNAQLIRDDFRGKLRETGVADDNYEVTLADGSKFNIGLDGKTRYKNVGTNINDKTTRQAWDVDFSNPLAVFATEQIDPMIQRIYEGVDRSKIPTEQFTGMLVNAVTSNAKSNEDVLANIRTVLGQSIFAKEAGFDPTPIPGPTQPIVRPEAGKVLRVSPGMYMNDQGKISPALTMKQALELNYGKES